MPPVFWKKPILLACATKNTNTPRSNTIIAIFSIVGTFFATSLTPPDRLALRLSTEAVNIGLLSTTS